MDEGAHCAITDSGTDQASVTERPVALPYLCVLEVVMSATIQPFIRDTTFGPEALAVMGNTFDRACEASGGAGVPIFIQEVLAACIIEVAKTGERQPEVLCDRALEAIGLPGSAVRAS